MEQNDEMNSFTGNDRFEKATFTGHKDTDRLILLNLNGKDLLSFCSSTPYLNSICDEDLFKNKIRNTPLEKVKEKYPDLNYRNFYAVMMYYIGLLKEKFNYNYDTDDPKVQYKLLQRHENKNLILIEASQLGELGLVKWLLQKGADIHANDDKALRYAALNGYLEAVKYLVDHGADIHATDDLALTNAARNGHLEVVKYLIEHGANIYAHAHEALRVATDNNHLEVVKYLKSLM